MKLKILFFYKFGPFPLKCLFNMLINSSIVFFSFFLNPFSLPTQKGNVWMKIDFRDLFHSPFTCLSLTHKHSLSLSHTHTLSLTLSLCSIDFCLEKMKKKLNTERKLNWKTETQTGQTSEPSFLTIEVQIAQKNLSMKANRFSTSKRHKQF